MGGQGVGTAPSHFLGSWFPFPISSFLRQKLGCFPLHSFSSLPPSDQHNHNQAVASHVDKGCFLPSWSVKGTVANTSPGIVFSSPSSHYVNCFIQPMVNPIYHSSYNRTGILRPCLADFRELIFCRNRKHRLKLHHLGSECTFNGERFLRGKFYQRRSEQMTRL